MKMLMNIAAAAALVVTAAGCGAGAPPPAIAAPSDLQVEAFSPDQISLSWVDNSDNENGFRIYRSDDGSNFSVVDTNVLPSFTDFGVTGGVTYSYRVTAYNSTDESAPSNTISVTPEEYYVDILTPDGGETLTIGEMYDISWTSNMPNYDAVIMLSTDGGSTFPHVLRYNWNPNSSPYPWKVGYVNTEDDNSQPPVWEQVIFGEQTECVIYIEEYNKDSVCDLSEGMFTISP